MKRDVDLVLANRGTDRTGSDAGGETFASRFETLPACMIARKSDQHDARRDATRWPSHIALGLVPELPTWRHHGRSRSARKAMASAAPCGNPPHAHTPVPREAASIRPRSQRQGAFGPMPTRIRHPR